MPEKRRYTRRSAEAIREAKEIQLDKLNLKLAMKETAVQRLSDSLGPLRNRIQYLTNALAKDQATA